MTTPKTILSIFVLSLFTLASVSASASASPDPKCEVVIVGAGIGGAYLAYRLAVEARAVDPAAICIFEARPRPGGRILSVRDPLPGFEGFSTDLGAYRFRRNRHALTRMVNDRMLNLSYACYTSALRKEDLGFEPECNPSPARRILSLRGRVFDYSPSAGTGPAEALQSFSAASVPYNVPPDGQWGPGSPANLTTPRDLNYLFGTLLSPSSSPVAVLREYLPALLDPAANYSAATAAADAIIAALPTATLDGIPLGELTLWEYAVRLGIAPDERRLLTDTGGVGDADYMYSPLKYALRDSIRELALSKAPYDGPRDVFVHPLADSVRDGESRPRASMIELVDALLKGARAAGVRVFYNRRVVSVQRASADSARMRVSYLDGAQANSTRATGAGTVFLNVPKDELLALGRASEPMLSAGPALEQAVSRQLPISLTKTYCFWDDAWWVTKLNLTSGSFRAADEPLFEGRYHDGDVQCAQVGNRSTCRGSLMVSYIGGSSVGADDVSWLRALNPAVYSPWTNSLTDDNVRKLVPGAMTPHEQRYFEQIHAALRRVHAGTFRAFGLNVSTDLPDAAGCVYADWKRSAVHFEQGGGGSTDPAEPFVTFAQPVKGLNLSLVNEAWGELDGWAESSLRAAERALFHVHGIGRPAWMDDITHRSLVRWLNSGRALVST